MLTMWPWRMRCLFTTALICDARAEFAPLRLRAKNTDLRTRQIFQNDFRHVGQRAGGVFFENEDGVLRADFFHFLLQGGGDLPRRLVGNNRDPFVRFSRRQRGWRCARRE